MARPLLTSSMHNLPFSISSMHMPMPMTLFFVVLALLSVFSVISFLCGTKKMKKYQTKTEEATTRSKERKVVSKLNSNLSNRALSMVKMLSWRKVRAEEEEEEEEREGDYSDQGEEVLWRKNILMGERCRPVDFSGKIVYDSEGNMLPDLSQQNIEHHQH